jgi:hypothetical protein
MLRARTGSSTTGGFASLEVVFAVLVVIALGLTGYFVMHDSSKTATPVTTSAKAVTTPSTTTNAYAVLAPATVPSKIAECSTPITFAGNGNSGPIQCANGGLNVTEWNALAALEPTVMSLGYGATPGQIQPALCADANASDSDANTKNGSIVEATVYQISALYYGWSFTTNPAAVLSGGGCS